MGCLRENRHLHALLLTACARHFLSHVLHHKSFETLFRVREFACGVCNPPSVHLAVPRAANCLSFHQMQVGGKFS
jgi:hypothetical protein